MNFLILFAFIAFAFSEFKTLQYSNSECTGDPVGVSIFPESFCMQITDTMSISYACKTDGTAVSISYANNNCDGTGVETPTPLDSCQTYQGQETAYKYTCSAYTNLPPMHYEVYYSSDSCGGTAAHVYGKFPEGCTTYQEDPTAPEQGTIATCEATGIVHHLYTSTECSGTIQETKTMDINECQKVSDSTSMKLITCSGATEVLASTFVILVMIVAFIF